MLLRQLIIASVFIIGFGIPGPASAQTVDTYTDNHDLPGGDYRNFDITGGADACRTACLRDDKTCRAWTYVKATRHCWLKNSVPAARSNDCCTSGIPGSGKFDR
jgi:hypothetical protein